MGTAMKHPVPDRVKSSFVIFDTRTLYAQGWASECPDVENYKWRLNPVWHRMLYCCTHATTVGVKGLTEKKPYNLLNCIMCDDFELPSNDISAIMETMCSNM